MYSLGRFAAQQYVFYSICFPLLFGNVPMYKICCLILALTLPIMCAVPLHHRQHHIIIIATTNTIGRCWAFVATAPGDW
jgi:hypothetical protein